ncbi:MAG TPA: NADH-quinone oxidoreductase subunit N [Actinomycetota bacterium]
MAPEIVLRPIVPEMIVAGAAMAILLVDAFRSSRDRLPLALIALAAVVGAAASAISLWGWDGPGTVLGGMVASDRYGVFFRLVILGVAALAILLSLHGRDEERGGEFYALLLFSTTGMSLLAVSSDLIMVFLSLEMLSLSLYVLAGSSIRRPASREAGMKYFLLGAFSTAFLLYGIALAYGATGTTSLSGIAGALAGRTDDLGLALAAAALLTVGFSFKVSAVPFHMWTPDVYQGAPTAVTAFMSAGTKVAGFAALLRVASSALGPVGWDLTPALWLVAALTMVVGSVLAIAQRDVKRLLAYSSVAHAGFVLVGVVAANQQGISGAMFYLVAYAAMILGAFGIVMIVAGRDEERTTMEDYAGLARRSPVLAASLGLFLLSLAGLPPTAGFIAKVLVFQAAVDAGHWALVVVGVVATVIAAYFYIRVIVAAYMEEPEDRVAVSRAPVPGFAVGVAAVLTLLFGVLPFLLLGVLDSASILRF